VTEHNCAVDADKNIFCWGSNEKGQLNNQPWSARGEAHEESDVDVLVIIEDLAPVERGRVYEEGAEVWMDTGVPLAPLAASPEDWRRMEEEQGRLITQDVAREGIAF
jgi:hypothetical protein